MNFEKELKKRKTNIRACSVQSDIPYATLYPIIKGRVDIGTCSYFTVAKLARFLGYRPDEIVYEKEDFQTFRNNLHHRIKRCFHLYAARRLSEGILPGCYRGLHQQKE